MAEGALLPMIEEADLVRCIHCGICLPHCPTFHLTRLEVESPRGRLALMRGVSEGLIGWEEAGEFLDTCLGCLACQAACPAGVPYGRLLDESREQLVEHRAPRGFWRRRLVAGLFGWLLEDRHRLAWLARLTARAHRLGLVEAARRLVRRGILGGLAGRLILLAPEPDPAAGGREPVAGGGELPAASATGLFLGCIQEAFLPRVNRATVALLAEGGPVFEPTGQTCCGALAAHQGERELARRQARRNVEAFRPLLEQGEGPIVVNAAGCGAFMKEYGEYLADDPEYAPLAREFSRRVRDVSEWLAARDTPSPLPGGRGAPGRRVAYQAACHLVHSQGIREAPLATLEAAGCEVVPLDERCCGAAGTYNLEQPETADALREEKIAAIRRLGVDTVVTTNPGCQLHLQAGLREAGLAGEVRVVHLVELLQKLRGEEGDRARREKEEGS